MYLAGKFQERYGHPVIGHLYSPGGWKTPVEGIPYALDNGAWSAFKNGLKYEAKPFLNMCEKASRCGIKPLWVVVPDVVGDRSRTIASWTLWAPIVREYVWPLALACQDGMTIEDIEGLKPKPDILFIGGTTEWKRNTIHYWCENFSRVHVGRINTLQWLWYCLECGVESIDGTGWFHHRELNQLETFLHNMKSVRAQMRMFK